MLIALDLIDKVTLSIISCNDDNNNNALLYITRLYIVDILYITKKNRVPLKDVSIYRISIFWKEMERETKSPYLDIDDGSFCILFYFKKIFIIKSLKSPEARIRLLCVYY